MAAVADGWFASAYNATPDQYREARVRLDEHLRAAGREPDDFPDAIATMWLFVTDSRREAEHVLTAVLAPALNRDPRSCGSAHRERRPALLRSPCQIRGRRRPRGAAVAHPRRRPPERARHESRRFAVSDPAKGGVDVAHQHPIMKAAVCRR